MEWKTVKLGDWMEFNPKRTICKNVIARKITMDMLIPYQKSIDKFSYEPYSGGAKFRNGDTIMARITPCLENGKHSYISCLNEGEVAYGSTEYIVLCGKDGVSDNDYVYYLSKTPYFRDIAIKSMVGSSGRQRAQVDVLQQILMDVPANIEDQRRIAAILSSLDDKIENNNRINRNLEAQAQALFKSWFVDFEPWGGTMPKDWKETTIGEMCTCYLGGTPSRAKSEYWNGDIPWINSGEVNKYRIIEGSEYITELGLKKSATKLLPKKTTVLAITGATLGQVSLLEIEACANQSVIGILENEKMPYEFIYPLIVNDIEKIILNQTGGAQQHINKDNVESHNIIIPTDEIMAKYKAIQAPLFETIANNCLESSRLAQLRDTLLPKLMKGEINI